MLLVVDQAGGTTPGATTFRTIQEAANAAKPGDLVTIKAGTYKESVSVPVSGTAEQPIVFSADKGAILIGASRSKPCFSIKGQSYIHVLGLTTEGGRNGVAVDKGINDRPSSFVRIEGCHISGSISSGIRSAFSENISVIGNVVTKTNRGGVHEMISVIDTKGFVVSSNEVFNGEWVDEDGPIEGKEGIDVKGASSDGEVTNNYVHDLTRLGIYLDAWDQVNQNIKVTGNTVERCKQGIALASEAGGLLKNVLVANNVVTDNVRFGIIVAGWVEDGPREDIRIFHNSCIRNGSGGVGVTTRNVTRLRVANNLTIKGKPLHDPEGVATSVGNLIAEDETQVGDSGFLVPFVEEVPLDKLGVQRGLVRVGAYEK